MIAPRAWVLLALLSLACGTDDDDGGASTSGPATTSGTPGTSSSGDDVSTTSIDDPPPDTSSTGELDDSSGGSTIGASESTGGSETAAAGPTWENFAMMFFETYCWECHGPGDALRDYSMLEDVMAEANAIRCGTAPVGSGLDGCAGEPPAGQFPIGNNLPTDDERAMLVEWIDAGLP